MEIKTEQDMIEFCKQAKGPFSISIDSPLNNFEERVWQDKNDEMIKLGKIGKSSHLQQGILKINYWRSVYLTEFTEAPLLYPSQKILIENPKLTGPLTGNLSNCFDPETDRFLFHMRRQNISAPFGFQAAAAGMSRFREHPYTTAKKELAEEAGIEYPLSPFQNRAIDVLPFMKAGKVPQLLFSFGFLNDLSEFPVCRSLDDIAKFESRTKQALAEGREPHREAYPFTVHYASVEGIAGELNDKRRFYGPIYQSTINFIGALRDAGYL